MNETQSRPIGSGTAGDETAEKLPPRARILQAAGDLFYRQGIRAVGVEAVAEAADTNKMTLYRHFASKDDLVAECIAKVGERADATWAALETAHPGDPRGLLLAWLRGIGARIADPADRGCAMVNAAVEIAEKDHPARRVVETFKRAERERLAGVCARAGARDPAMLADELILLLEGARVCSQSTGRDGPAARVVRMGETLIAAHLDTGS